MSTAAFMESGDLPSATWSNFKIDNETLFSRLREKLQGKLSTLSDDRIQEADAYNCHPKTIVEHHPFPSSNSCYVYSTTKRRHGNIAVRTAGSGRWKATRGELPIYSGGNDDGSNQALLGHKISLAYHDEDGQKTDWLMDEYFIKEFRNLSTADIKQKQVEGEDQHDNNSEEENVLDRWVVCYIHIPPRKEFTDNILFLRLREKLQGSPLTSPGDTIEECNVYSYHPETIVEHHAGPGSDSCYVYSTTIRRYGNVAVRTAGSGRWKATRGEVPVYSGGKDDGSDRVLLGHKISLAYHDEDGKKTEWLMDEYFIKEFRNLSTEDRKRKLGEGEDQHGCHSEEEKVLDRWVVCYLHTSPRTGPSSSNAPEEHGREVEEDIPNPVPVQTSDPLAVLAADSLVALSTDPRSYVLPPAADSAQGRGV